MCYHHKKNMSKYSKHNIEQKKTDTEEYLYHSICIKLKKKL